MIEAPYLNMQENFGILARVVDQERLAAWIPQVLLGLIGIQSVEDVGALIPEVHSATKEDTAHDFFTLARIWHDNIAAVTFNRVCWLDVRTWRTGALAFALLGLFARL